MPTTTRMIEYELWLYGNDEGYDGDCLVFKTPEAAIEKAKELLHELDGLEDVAVWTSDGDELLDCIWSWRVDGEGKAVFTEK